LLWRALPLVNVIRRCSHHCLKYRLMNSLPPSLSTPLIGTGKVS